jgi:hypothetical protein
MNRYWLFLLTFVSFFAALPASAEETICVVGEALVSNAAEDQTIGTSAGIIYQVGGNIQYGPLGTSVTLLPAEEAILRTPNTYIAASAAAIEIYLSDSEYAGIIYSTVWSCDSAPEPVGGTTSAAFHDGRLVQEPWASATLYRTQADSYAVWGIDAAGSGFAAFSFTCDEAQTRLRQALDSDSAGGNILLFDYPVPARGGSIQLWGVPSRAPSGATRIDLVLIATGQGADNNKNTVVPLPELCPALQA